MSITVVGSINMDLVVTTPKVPSMGETLLGSGFMTVPGGKGANQAVAAALLGGDVAMVGCVGDDENGRALAGNLENAGVRMGQIHRLSGTPSGVAVIIVKDGDNCIIVAPGANSSLTPEMIGDAEETIRQSRIVMLQLEIPIETVEATVRLARKHGVRVLLNPAPARPLTDEILRMTDIFTPNESECAAITGIPIDSMDDAERAVRRLLDQGIGNVVVTLGDKGVVYNDGSEICRHPAYPVEVVDTTAAGDSFSAGLAVALSEGRSIPEAVAFATAVGAITVTRKGAQSSLPTRQEVDRFIANRT